MAGASGPRMLKRWRSKRGATAAQYLLFVLLLVVVCAVTAILLINSLDDRSGGLTLLGSAL